MYVDGNTISGDAKVLLSMGWRGVVTENELERTGQCGEAYQ